MVVGVPFWDATTTVAVQQACAAARAGATAYVRVRLSYPGIDPFQVLGHSTDHTFAWSDGTRRLTLVAGPAAAIIEPRNDANLEQLCHDLRASVHGDLSGPLFFGGCAFSSSSNWPDWPLARFVLPQWLLIRDADGATNCYLTVRVHAGDTQVDVLTKLRSVLPPQSAEPDGRSDEGCIHVTPVESKASWMERVDAAATTVAEGALAKVVLAREVLLTPPEGYQFDAGSTLRRLRKLHSGSITFSMHIDGHGTFLGATPETLVEVHDTEVQTHALAGTIRRGSTEEEDQRLAQALFESAKDRVEHRVVVDAMVDTLRPLCSELAVSEVPHPIRLSQVQHLATPIVGRLKARQNALTLARCLHPTPAVGGWPRSSAAQYLDEQEPTRRGWYAAPIGWMDSEFQGVFGVAIRSALISPESARAWVGAGIVGASDPDAEWRETALKLRTIVSGLAVRKQDDSTLAGGDQ